MIAIRAGNRIHLHPRQLAGDEAVAKPGLTGLRDLLK